MGSFWWKDVFKLNPTFRGITQCEVLSGSSVLFWKDNWLGLENSSSYPRAYSYAQKEDISVQEFLTTTDLAALFHLPLSPQALNEIRALQQASLHVSLDGNAAGDSWIFQWGSKSYAASKYYKFCHRNITPHDAFLWLWKSKSTPKLKFFCWLLLADRLNTRNMLRRRHFNIGNNYSCLLCNSAPEETVEHLFFHCPFSRECWSELGFSWGPANNRLTMVSFGKDNWNAPLFMEIFTTAAWSIWKERNRLLFEGFPHSLTSWKVRFKEDFSLLQYRTKSSLHPYIFSLVNRL